MKAIQTLCLAVGLMVLIPPAVLCQEKKSEEKFDVHGYISTGPQYGYIGRRISRNLFPGWMQWTELDINLENGVFLNLWDSMALERLPSNTHAGDEFDATIGWRGEIPGDFRLRLSTTLFNLYPIDTWWTKDVAVQSLWLSKQFDLGEHSLIPELRTEWISKTSDFGGGALILIPMITHVWQRPFGIEKLKLFNTSAFARDDGFNGAGNNSKGIFYRWDGAIELKLSKNLFLTPSVTVQVPLNNPHDGRENVEVASGISLRYKF